MHPKLAIPTHPSQPSKEQNPEGTNKGKDVTLKGRAFTKTVLSTKKVCGGNYKLEGKVKVRCVDIPPPSQISLPAYAVTIKSRTTIEVEFGKSFEYFNNHFSLSSGSFLSA